MVPCAEMPFLLSNPALLESFGPRLFMKPSCVIPCFLTVHALTTPTTRHSFTVLLGLACLDCELFEVSSITR